MTILKQGRLFRKGFLLPAQLTGSWNSNGRFDLPVVIGSRSWRCNSYTVIRF